MARRSPVETATCHGSLFPKQIHASRPFSPSVICYSAVMGNPRPRRVAPRRGFVTLLKDQL